MPMNLVAAQGKKGYEINGVAWDLPGLPQPKKDQKSGGYLRKRFKTWCHEFVRCNYQEMTVLQKHFEIIYKAFEVVISSQWSESMQNLHRKASEACRDEASGETAQKILIYGNEYARHQCKETAAENKKKKNKKNKTKKKKKSNHEPNVPLLADISTEVSLTQPNWWMRKCAICSSAYHLINSCTVLWGSYNVFPFELYRTGEFPIYCYNCGKPGHTCSLREWDSWTGRYSRRLREQFDGLMVRETRAGECECDMVEDATVMTGGTRGQGPQCSQKTGSSGTQEGASTKTARQKSDQDESQGDRSTSSTSSANFRQLCRSQKRKAGAEPKGGRAQKVGKGS